MSLPDPHAAPHWSVAAARIVGTITVVLTFGGLAVYWVVGTSYFPENAATHNTIALAVIAVLVVCLVFFWSGRARASHVLASLVAAVGLGFAGFGAFALVTNIANVVQWVGPFLLGTCLLVASVVPRFSDITGKGAT